MTTDTGGRAIPYPPTFGVNEVLWLRAAIKRHRADARNGGLEEAAKVAHEYECRKQKVCCKLQLFSVGHDILALKTDSGN